MLKIPVVKSLNEPTVIIGYLEASEELLSQLRALIEEDAPIGLDIQVKDKTEIQCIAIQSPNVFSQIKEG